jgi:hypothetical protein
MEADFTTTLPYGPGLIAAPNVDRSRTAPHLALNNLLFFCLHPHRRICETGG